jgi:hypothetical protein
VPQNPDKKTLSDPEVRELTPSELAMLRKIEQNAMDKNAAQRCLAGRRIANRRYLTVHARLVELALQAAAALSLAPRCAHTSKLALLPLTGHFGCALCPRTAVRRLTVLHP